MSSHKALAELIERCRLADPDGRVWLETDMRAHCNPTRMRSIRRLGIALVRRLQTPCSECGSPGLGADRYGGRVALQRVRHPHRAHPLRNLGLRSVWAAPKPAAPGWSAQRRTRPVPLVVIHSAFTNSGEPKVRMALHVQA